MSRQRVVFYKTVKPGIFKAQAGAASAMVVAHICNGHGVYGFDEPAPAPEVEAALLKRSDKQVARLIEGAKGLGQ